MLAKLHCKSANESISETASVRSLRILIVEDSDDNRILMKVYLRGSPHQLTFAENGKVAVDLFSDKRFDLILMDRNMPLMDGLTATRSIRAIEKERGLSAIPIIALTANAQPQDVESSFNAGSNQHLSKPISRLSLIKAIESYALDHG